MALAADDAPTITFPFTVALVNVPTLVKLDPITVEFKVAPVKVPASAVTVISPLPSKSTLFIFLAVANFVAVVAVPAVVAVVAVLALPLIDPVMVVLNVFCY